MSQKDKDSNRREELENIILDVLSKCAKDCEQITIDVKQNIKELDENQRELDKLLKKKE